MPYIYCRPVLEWKAHVTNIHSDLCMPACVCDVFSFPSSVINGLVNEQVFCFIKLLK